MENRVFANRIREARAEKRLTQAEIAQKIGVSVTAYAGYEQGYREPNLDILTRLADFFECSIDYLTGREDDFGVITIQNAGGKELSVGEKEICAIYAALPAEYQAQILEYARYFYERCGEKKNKA